MADTFSDFLSEHRDEHQTAFNRWCLVLGDLLQVIGAGLATRGHRRKGGTVAAVGYGVVILGHVRERNLPRSFETARLHPMWTIRADAAVARDLLTKRR